MKANELMLGDFIYHKENDYYGEVTGVFDTGEIYIDGVIAYIADCAPIPLTPEILEKNAFKPFEVNYEPKNLIGKWWDKNGYVCVKQYCLSNVSYRKGHTVFTVSTGIHSRIGNIIFIHQFQHALKLCGIEKTIEL